MTILILSLAVCLAFFVCLYLILFAGYFIQYLRLKIQKFPGGYGRFLRSTECFLYAEKFVNFDRNHSIVSTFELDSDVTIEIVRQLFENRILNICLPGSCSRLWYPEFRQYITSLFGFLIWKDDPIFRIGEHIFEEKLKDTRLHLDELHQRLHNQKFKDNKSPWEIRLFRNVVLEENDNLENCSTKTVLAFRVHHIMCDAKSILNLFVEHLGQKKLNTAEASDVPLSFLRKVALLIAFPCYGIRAFRRQLFSPFRHLPHPWKVKHSDNSEVIVKFTKPLNIKKLKCVALKNDVSVSSVLIALIVESINLISNKSNRMLGCVLSKSDHPITLANHFRANFGMLPPNLQQMKKSDRLQVYNGFYKKLRKPEETIPLEALLLLTGSLPGRLRKIFQSLSYLPPVLITNVAGERDGFFIGDAWCSNVRMSSCVPIGNCGVVFEVFGYREHIHISLTGKESIISEIEAMSVIRRIEMEYDDAHLV